MGGEATHQDGAMPLGQEVGRTRVGPMPVAPMLTITHYTKSQLVRLIRWIESDTLLRTDDELREAAIQALGYRRRGSRIVAALDDAIRIAHGTSSRVAPTCDVIQLAVAGVARVGFRCSRITRRETLLGVARCEHPHH